MSTKELIVKYRHYRIPSRGVDIPEKLTPSKVKKVARQYSKKKKWLIGSFPCNPTPKGGATICRIYDGDVVVAGGMSICSMEDNFCYRTGRDIAFGRAIKALKGQ